MGTFQQTPSDDLHASQMGVLLDPMLPPIAANRDKRKLHARRDGRHCRVMLKKI